MFRLNIENDLWADHRFIKLILLLNSDFMALGVVVKAWQVAQKYWCPDQASIPENIFIEAGFPEQLIECGMAIRKLDGVYISGTKEHFQWWFDCRDSGSKGGKEAKARRRVAIPTLQPPTSEVYPLTLDRSLTKEISIKKEENKTFIKETRPKANVDNFDKVKDLTNRIIDYVNDQSPVQEPIPEIFGKYFNERQWEFVVKNRLLSKARKFEPEWQYKNIYDLIKSRM